MVSFLQAHTCAGGGGCQQKAAKQAHAASHSPGSGYLILLQLLEMRCVTRVLCCFCCHWCCCSQSPPSTVTQDSRGPPPSHCSQWGPLGPCHPPHLVTYLPFPIPCTHAPHPTPPPTPSLTPPPTPHPTPYPTPHPTRPHPTPYPPLPPPHTHTLYPTSLYLGATSGTCLSASWLFTPTR